MACMGFVGTANKIVCEVYFFADVLRCIQTYSFFRVNLRQGTPYFFFIFAGDLQHFFSLYSSHAVNSPSRFLPPNCSYLAVMCIYCPHLGATSSSLLVSASLPTAPSSPPLPLRSSGVMEFAINVAGENNLFTRPA